MYEMTDVLFKDFLFDAFIDFQKKKRKNSITAFADYLTKSNQLGTRFSQQLVSGWLNGDFSPSEKYAPALADVLGESVYTILEMDPPDTDLEIVNALWAFIPEEKRREIREQAEQYRAGNEKDVPNHSTRRESQTSS
jgi:hypothetical protein